MFERSFISQFTFIVHRQHVWNLYFCHGTWRTMGILLIIECRVLYKLTKTICATQVKWYPIMCEMFKSPILIVDLIKSPYSSVSICLVCLRLFYQVYAGLELLCVPSELGYYHCLVSSFLLDIAFHLKV